MKQSRISFVEALEARIAPATIVVTSTLDSGPGTLRQAILDANANPDTDTITFNFPGTAIISPLSPLPAITDRVVIEHLNNLYQVIISGENAGPDADGLVLTGVRSHYQSLIKGITIDGFSGSGIVLANGGSNAVANCVISSNGSHGVEVSERSNVIAGNEIFANGGDGIRVAGLDSIGNLLRDNLFLQPNGGLDIDLDGDGPTPNDPGDFDSGANYLQNTPVIFEAVVLTNTAYVRGELRSTPSSKFTIDLYAYNRTLGSFEVTTDADGLAQFTSVVTGDIEPSTAVRATATRDPGDTGYYGSTSELSRYAYFAPGEELIDIRGSATAVFTDVDGDKVTIKSTRGALDYDNFVLVPEGKGARLVSLSIDESFNRGSISITAAKSRTGDGFVNVGIIEGDGVDLDSLTVDGDLNQLTLGKVGNTRSLDRLIVRSLGVKNPWEFGGPRFQFTGGVGDVIVSGGVANSLIHIGASIRGSFKVGGDFGGSTLLVENAVRSMSVGGDLVHSMIRADTIGSLTVKGEVAATPEQAVEVRVAGLFIPVDRPAPALGSFVVGKNVTNLSLFAGYADYVSNPDASIGTIKAGGNWTSSNVAVGIQVGADGKFGTDDDSLLPGGDPATIARIASITIKGTISGNGSDSFGFIAEQIGSFRLGGKLLPLTGERDALSLTPSNDVFVREVSELVVTAR